MVMKFSYEKRGIVVALFLNIFSSTGTIFLNKFLFKNFGFEFGTALTVFHFFGTFLFTLLCLKLGVFQFKKIDVLKLLPISLSFCGYVVFNNISLLYNSVSFYQIMKILCTPVVLGIDYFSYGTTVDKKIMFSLIPVCVGIFISVFTDTEVNFIGTIFSVLAIISNSLYTVWGKRKVKELDAKPMQVLLYNSLVSGTILSIAIPFLDDSIYLFTYIREDLTFYCFIIILMSCCTAFFVNFSFFLLSGKTTPLTVNMVGYFKTCVVFFGGIYLFQAQVNLKNIAGIAITLFGLAWYTYIKVQLQNDEIKESILPTDQK